MTTTKQFLTLIIAGILLCSSLSALQVNFSNNGGGLFASGYTPVVNSDGTPVADGSGSISLGYFTNEAAVGEGDFTSFQLFGSSTTFGDAGFPGMAGVFNNVTSQNLASGNPFIDQTVTFFIVNNSEFLVAKTATTFIETAGPTTEITVDLNAAGITYLFGGATGPSIDVTGGGLPPTPSVELSAVPEPSAFALLAGCFGLGWVMLRRRV